MKEQDYLLCLEDVTKIFVIGGRFLGVKLVAVNKESFNIKKDKPEIFTIAGETGSGKTTLARMILGLLEPTSGRILYKGKDISELISKERKYFMREVQPIFQNPFEAFNPLKRVDSYLFETVINFNMGQNKKDVMNIIDDLLGLVGLTYKEVEKRYPHELSGGQLQRISIARALITRPSLLVADEPVSMVDASLRMSIVNLFRELKERLSVTVLYITHDLATAYYISDRIAIMYRGNIVELGPVDKVMLNPLHPYTRLLISSVPEADIDKRWTGEIKLSAQEVKEFSKLGCKFSDRCEESSDICFNKVPIKVYIDDRWVMCHKYDN